MKKYSKQYSENIKLRNKETGYDISSAVKFFKIIKKKKFNENIDVVFNIKNTKNTVFPGGFIRFPNKTEIYKKIIVISDTLNSEIKAEKPYKIGKVDLLKEIIEAKKFDFDLIITEPKYMKNFAMFGKQLGPHHLMPNHKNKTITTNILKTLKDFNHGCAEIKVDKTNNLNISIGKISLKENEIIENYNYAFNFILKLFKVVSPAQFFSKISISLTMSPAVLLKFK